MQHDDGNSIGIAALFHVDFVIARYFEYLLAKRFYRRIETSCGPGSVFGRVFHHPCAIPSLRAKGQLQVG